MSTESRLESILGTGNKNGKTTDYYARGVAQDGKGILDLRHPGQQGYLSEMSFFPASTDHVKMPLIVKVVRAPYGLTLMDRAFNGGKDHYVTAWKNMIETMMQSWSGFNRTLSISSNETQTGHAGESFQTPTRVSRQRSNITSTIVEKDRRIIIRFLEDYTRYLIGDPEVGYPLMSGFSEEFGDRLADMYAGTIIAYEPDKTFRYVDNAYLITNFYLNNDVGENTSSRQLQQDGEVPTYNLTWAGFQKVGTEVDRLAQSFIDKHRINGLDPQRTNLIANEIADNISSISTGFGEQITDIKNNHHRNWDGSAERLPE